jgi:hypothetical protein
MPRTLFASVNLIGDTITQTPALRRYRAEHPDEQVDWLLQDGPHRSFFMHVGGTAACDRVLFDSDCARIRQLAYPDYDKRFLMDVEKAFAIGTAECIHIAQAFGRLIGVDVLADDVLPTVPVIQADLDAVGVPSRCLVISAQSVTSHSVNGFAGSKNLPWQAWPQIVERFLQAGRIENYVVLLRDVDAPPEVPLCVLRFPLSLAVAYIAKACAQGGAYCGVDNGMTHLAAGLKVPTFCVYPQSLADTWVGYSRFPHYRVARTVPWKGDLNQIWDCWKNRL